MEKIWQHRHSIQLSKIILNFPLHRSFISAIAAGLCSSYFFAHVPYANGADAPSVTPLYSFNQSPLIQIYGLPALGESYVLGPDESLVAVHLQFANHFTGTTINSETLSLDGETHRLTLHWRRGLSGNWEWGFELPYVSHSGGFLDMSIEEFHDIFSMQQNGRTELSRNRIDYRYSRDGINIVSLNRDVSGIGDVRLFAGKPIGTQTASSSYTAAWRVSLKVPTGEASELLGSGSTDLATWLSAATTRPPDNWNLYGGGGLLLMSESDVLADQQRHLVTFGTLGIRQKLFTRVTISAQLDTHTPFYSDTALRQMGHIAAIGLIGVEWEFEPKSFVTFSISEDLIVGASPDVAFNLTLTLPL